MAMFTQRRSTLNPDAPLFIPAAVRQVEDFSPEWWQLVTTSTWFHDYWLSQQHGEDGFFGSTADYFDTGDIVDMLPDSIDTDEDLLSMEAQYEQFLLSSDAKAIPGSPVDMARYPDTPVMSLSPKVRPQGIQQPRSMYN